LRICIAERGDMWGRIVTSDRDATEGEALDAGATREAAQRRMIDPVGLTAAQRSGRACVSCRKRWPRPSVLAGHLPDGAPLYVCDDCVALVEPVERTAPPHAAQVSQVSPPPPSPPESSAPAPSPPTSARRSADD